MLRLPKTENREVLESLDRKWKPKGSTKGYTRAYLRKTFIMRRSLLQRLEAFAFWKSGEQVEGVSVNDALDLILEDYFNRNEVKPLPLGEIYEQIGRAHV